MISVGLAEPAAVRSAIIVAGINVKPAVQRASKVHMLAEAVLLS